MYIRQIPYPYQSWISISNDPDNTLEPSWIELHEYIFKELKLDWANSIFPVNRNLNLPKQVSLESHPNISIQPTDAIHTWGDFVHSGSQGFSRNEARNSISILNKYNIKPKIWVDHSRFIGNYIHGHTTLGGKKYHKDASGITYKNHEYSADLIHDLGIRYLWDGELTQIIGQNRKISITDVNEIGYKKYFFGGRINNELINVVSFENFKFYVFKRFGQWRNADILGLSKVITPDFIKKSIKNRGFSIVYTHLGKRNPNQTEESHIPNETKRALLNLKTQIDKKNIKFSPVSKLLDYCIILQNISISKNNIHINPDHIRYVDITDKDLSGFTFSFILNKNDKFNEINVYINGLKSTSHKIIVQGKNVSIYYE